MARGYTRQKAIYDMCKWCIYDPLSGLGTWKEQVAQCASCSCPLWPFRPAPSGGEWKDPPRDPLKMPAGWPLGPIGEP